MLSSYVHGTTTAPLLGQTIGASLDHIAARFGDRDALISCHQNARYTYAQLLDEVNRAARGLLALGVQRGDRVGIWSPNVAEWVITQYAAAKVGAILVNLNPGIPPTRARICAQAVGRQRPGDGTQLPKDRLHSDPHRTRARAEGCTWRTARHRTSCRACGM